MTTRQYELARTAYNESNGQIPFDKQSDEEKRKWYRITRAVVRELERSFDSASYLEVEIAGGRLQEFIAAILGRYL